MSTPVIWFFRKCFPEFDSHAETSAGTSLREILTSFHRDSVYETLVPSEWLKNSYDGLLCSAVSHREDRISNPFLKKNLRPIGSPPPSVGKHPQSTALPRANANAPSTVKSISKEMIMLPVTFTLKPRAKSNPTAISTYGSTKLMR